MAVKPKITRPILRRWLLIGVKVGLAWAILDFFIFFGIPEIREPAREILGHARSLFC